MTNEGLPPPPPIVPKLAEEDGEGGVPGEGVREARSCRPMLYIPIMTILATQRVMMSLPVKRTLVGYHFAKSGVWSGQPSVLWGQRALENQVSRTSSSRTNSFRSSFS